MSVGTILLIILVIVLLGGFSGFGGGPFYGTGYYGGGGLGLVIVILLILVLLVKLLTNIRGGCRRVRPQSVLCGDMDDDGELKSVTFSISQVINEQNDACPRHSQTSPTHGGARKSDPAQDRPQGQIQRQASQESAGDAGRDAQVSGPKISAPATSSRRPRS